jgi:hypothetical protein
MTTILDPRMTTSVPTATAEEAAAIAAALERFAHDTAPPPATGSETPDPWTRAAMLEGVMRARSAIGGATAAGNDHGDVPHPWINP